MAQQPLITEPTQLNINPLLADPIALPYTLLTAAERRRAATGGLVYTKGEMNSESLKKIVKKINVKERAVKVWEAAVLELMLGFFDCEDLTKLFMTYVRDMHLY